MSGASEVEQPPPGPVHVLVAGARADVPPLLLLHGSNGGERDLLDLAAQVAPGAARLGVRGAVAMDPGFAFFRRHEDRRVDVADLRARTADFARFVEAARARHGLPRPVAVGYSNGAIAALALLLIESDLLGGAVLLRPLQPLAPLPSRALRGVPVLVIDGAEDLRRAPEDGERTADALRRAGATVEHHRLPIGHGLDAGDVRLAREWMTRNGSVRR